MIRLALVFCVALLACGPRTIAPIAPTPSSPASSALPPIPLVEGVLRVRVQYPSAGALVQARDSTFIFGTVGNGRASLTINGTVVQVHPNGAFLAFLPLPSRDAAKDSARYELLAVLGNDTSRLTHPVRLAPARPVLGAEGPLVVDSLSVTPRGLLALRADERVRVSVRAPSNAIVWLRWDTVASARATLVSDAAMPGPRVVATDGAVDSIPSRYLGRPELWATEVPARLLTRGGQLFVTRGADTIRLPIASVALADSGRVWGVIGADGSIYGDTDRVTFARPTPDDTYRWFILPGTHLEITGRAGDFVRVRLDATLEAWVPAADVRPMPAGWVPPRRIAGNARIVGGREWSDLVIPIGARAAYQVEEQERALVLTLYGTQGATDVTRYVANDSLVRMVTWEQVATDRVRYTLQLAARPFGYVVFQDGSAFVLRVRRQPGINRSSPLRGLRIAVDPGHPPIGATGPTGLYEGDAVLAVGLRLRDMLQQRGATVIMTRSTPDAVALYDRPVIARRADAHALVSIHLNALPDGVNPFQAHGTETYFFHPQAEPLARAIQRGLVARMGLRDNGVYARSLALARPTWMPSVLAEGAYIMLPEHEAALRTPQYQDAYARGVVDGLEAYFRALAR